MFHVLLFTVKKILLQETYLHDPVLRRSATWGCGHPDVTRIKAPLAPVLQQIAVQGMLLSYSTQNKDFLFQFSCLSHQWHQNHTSSSRSETQRWFSSGKLFEILCLPLVTLLPRSPTWSPTRHPIAEGSCFKKSWVSPMQVSKPLLSESAFRNT